MHRFGPLVILAGAFSVAQKPATTAQVMALTLPPWAVPASTMDTLQYTNGAYVWRCRIHSDGNVYMRYYQSGTTPVAPAAGTTLNANAVWLAADAVQS